MEAGGSWPGALADHVRQNDAQLLEDAGRLLRVYEDEMLPCESFAEFCDVLGKYNSRRITLGAVYI